MRYGVQNRVYVFLYRLQCVVVRLAYSTFSLGKYTVILSYAQLTEEAVNHFDEINANLNRENVETYPASSDLLK
jgi:hypothetical protein